MTSSLAAVRLRRETKAPYSDMTIELAAEYMIMTFIAAWKPPGDPIHLELDRLARELRKLDVHGILESIGVFE